MSTLAFAPRYCKIKPNSSIIADDPVKVWDGSIMPVDTTFSIEQVYSNGRVLLRADVQNSTRVCRVTVHGCEAITVAPFPQLTVAEVSEILQAHYLEPKHHIGGGSFLPTLKELTIRVNASLNPHEEVMETYVSSLSTRLIVSAANLYKHHRLPGGRLIITGARHFDPIMGGVLDVIEATHGPMLNWTEGFIDQWGEFIDRKIAYQIVQSNGQRFSAKRNVSTDELFSEGLY